MQTQSITKGHRGNIDRLARPVFLSKISAWRLGWQKEFAL
jgi:hypothetical protein